MVTVPQRLKVTSKTNLTGPKRFEYDKLGNNDIRLLNLPGDWNEEICCTIFTANAHDHPPDYEAVSYTWGDPFGPRKYIRIMGSSTRSGRLSTSFVMRVSGGSFDALRRLRSPRGGVARTLWMDAVCVNQADIAERNAQVQKMKSIFSDAQSVLVYVGEAANDSAVLLESVRDSTLAGTTRTPAIVTRSKDGLTRIGDSMLHGPFVDNPMRCSLEAFLLRRWFSRIWVVQEVLLAKQATLICGEDEAPWSSFEAAVSSRYAEYATATVPLPAVLRGHAWPSLGLLGALQTARSCDATDPRDKVYGIVALLQLAHPGLDSASSIGVDYRKSVDAVFADVALAYLGSSAGERKLDLLSYVQSDTMASSWVPDWRVRSSRSLSAADSASGPDAGSLYSAGGHSYQHSVKVRTFDEAGRRKSVLEVKVVILGTIKELGDAYRAQGPRIGEREAGLGAWDTLVRTRRDAESNAPALFADPQADFELFHDSIVPDCIPPSSPKEEFDPDFKETFTTTFVDDFLMGSDSDDSQHSRPGSFCLWSNDHRYIEELGLPSQQCGVRMSVHRRLVLLNDGAFGFGPAAAQEGDAVGVILGASIPFVIRTTSAEGPGSEALSARLVGECWVRDVMHGEAVQQFDEDITVSEEFAKLGCRIESLDLY
ncbi:hypothetical protein B0A54_10469 [Friedmanniomyces endolithicus]|uniref:Heterokaryon incompatibility domain-containing protein n=1 Tax=Friedmanniomyces endolithicus TaxID=329885 RepID=A0A4U0UTW3_9PEZI|nr:hypothetical protein LTS09_012465 [Friedmanniomyces endolithicus]TKA39450.1 hypothetical protein B0A54_10469 [Friedmanniomyces endolithicus]